MKKGRELLTPIRNCGRRGKNRLLETPGNAEFARQCKNTMTLSKKRMIREIGCSGRGGIPGRVKMKKKAKKKERNEKTMKK